MRLTVLDIAEWFGETSGGIRTYLLAKSAYVQEHEELRQVLVLPGSKDEVNESQRVTTYRLRGPRIPLNPQYRFLLAVRSLGRIIQCERPDVIEVGSMFLAPWSVAIAARHRDIPRVAFYHGNVERRFAYVAQGAAAWRELTRGPLRWYLRQVDSVFDTRIAASDALCHDLESAGLTNVRRVPLGVDTAFFTPARRGYAQATRAVFQLPADRPVVAYVGRLAAEKELPLLLRAWPRIEAESSAVLLVMGDGPLAPTVERLARDCRIHYKPFERDRASVADVLAAVDLVVTPGSIETFGLAQLEAMASGTAVVAPRTGGAGEMVLRSGAGRRFAPGDAESLARTVTELVAQTETLRQLGKAGRAYAERHHSWSRVFEALFAHYDQLCQRRAPGDGAAPLKRWSAPRIERRERLHGDHV